MNCRELRNRAPLYISGEMQPPESREFAAHIAQCPACEADIEHQMALDARVRAALAQDAPDTTRVERTVRSRIAQSSLRRRWVVAGSIAAIVTLGIGLSIIAAPPAIYADAARDHQVEVIEGQPRHWRLDREGIEILTARLGLTLARAAALAPAGYRLERAKICGVGGQPMLHLVFASGERRYSVFLRPATGGKRVIRIVRRGPEQIAGFETGRYLALVVTGDREGECAQLARSAEQQL